MALEKEISFYQLIFWQLVPLVYKRILTSLERMMIFLTDWNFCLESLVFKDKMDAYCFYSSNPS